MEITCRLLTYNYISHSQGTADRGIGYALVYAPSDWHPIDGIWYDSENLEMGSVIWGSYARILQVSNDPYYDEHGVLYNPPSPTGFGYYNP